MSSSLSKPAFVAAILVVLFVVAWESYIRSTGFELAFDDGGPLWSHQRDLIYESKDHCTVFIGSSRIKFDLDIDTWEAKTGTHAVQLACVGSSPRPLLSNLADDPKFNGRLIIDVTEGLFFSLAPQNFGRPNDAIKYHKNISPTQRAGFWLNKPLESNFVFLDKEHFSMNALLDRIQIPNRDSVSTGPVFARDFGYTTFRRQDFVGKLFMADTAQQHQQQNVWATFGRMNKSKPIAGAQLDSILNLVKLDVEKIRNRGGEVFFVRTPSSGPFLVKEESGFPREKYWDQILSSTGCKGLHFKDYPAIDHYQCPEFSHLSPTDAIDFTNHFVDILKSDFGFSFPAVK